MSNINLMGEEGFTKVQMVFIGLVSITLIIQILLKLEKEKQAPGHGQQIQGNITMLLTENMVECGELEAEFHQKYVD